MQAVLSNEIQNSLQGVQSERIAEIARELEDYGLAIAMPHLHNDECVSPLPKDVIQYENNLEVSFYNKEEFEKNRKNGFPVMWRFNKDDDALEPCAWCHDD